jgi:glycosyltransferase involved in cell wall biosynthesis
MKIIVSQIGKQHVNALLLALLKRDVLAKFYTSIAANKFTPKLASFLAMTLGDNWIEKIKKQHFVGISNDQTVHFPFIALLKKVIKSEYWNVKIAHVWFDKLVANALKKADFDLLIGYENCNLLSFKMAKKRGKITILDLASMHHNFQIEARKDVELIQNHAEIEYISQRKERALMLTDYVFTLSDLAKKSLVDNGFPAQRIFKTYLGVNHQIFTPKDQYNSQNTDLSSGTHEGPLNLYFVGTLLPLKGISFLILLFDTLIQRGLNVRLTLIGPRSNRVKLPDLNADFVRHIPFLHHEELVKMHHALDLFVFPSHLDSWGQVVVEAMACGSPVLVSENTGARDAVAQGGGEVLPLSNVAAWVAAVEKFYFNRDLLQKLGKKAAFVAQQYTWEAYHQQVFEAIEAITQKEFTQYVSEEMDKVNAP